MLSSHRGRVLRTRRFGVPPDRPFGLSKFDHDPARRSRFGIYRKSHGAGGRTCSRHPNACGAYKPLIISIMGFVRQTRNRRAWLAEPHSWAAAISAPCNTCYRMLRESKKSALRDRCPCSTIRPQSTRSAVIHAQKSPITHYNP